METKNGNRFYVKTYGKPPKGGKQKWMVYLRKWHCGTFDTKEEAVKYAERQNSEPNWSEEVKKMERKKKEERSELCGKPTYDGVVASLRELKKVCDAMSGGIGKAISSIKKVNKVKGE